MGVALVGVARYYTSLPRLLQSLESTPRLLKAGADRSVITKCRHLKQLRN